MGKKKNRKRAKAAKEIAGAVAGAAGGVVGGPIAGAAASYVVGKTAKAVVKTYHDLGREEYLRQANDSFLRG